jgi:Leucine-rich repeat (LRR) protein
MEQFVWPDAVDVSTFDFWRSNNLSADTINLSDSQINDDFLGTITGIKHIKLSNCVNVTHVGIAKLKDIETLDISNNALTDEIALSLKGIPSINTDYCSKLTDRAFDHIDDVEYLNASNTNITDAILVHLKNTTTLLIRGCDGITDAGLANLNSIKKLRMTQCTKITNAGLLSLVGLETLQMRLCQQPTLTNEVFAALKNLKSLDISHCPQFTDDLFQYIPALELLAMERCEITGSGFTNLTNLKELQAYGSKLSDAGLASLRGLKTLNISQTKLTDAGFVNLQGIEELYMEECTLITDAGFASLDGIQYLDMTRCDQRALTDAAFVHLAGIKTLNMSGCVQITDAALANLTGITTLNVEGCSPNLFGQNMDALTLAGSNVFGLPEEDEEEDIGEPEDGSVLPQEPAEVVAPQVLERLQHNGTLSNRNDLTVKFPDIRSYTAESVDAFREYPIPDSISDAVHGNVSFEKFVVLNSGSGIVLRLEDSGVYLGISRAYLSAEMQSGNSMYYECSKKFTSTFEYSDIINKPYFALKTTNGSFYIPFEAAVLMLQNTHSFWKIFDITGLILSFTASRSAIIAGGPIMSADHCQGGTSKQVYNIQPFMFIVEDEEEEVPTTVGLKFGEERIEIPFVPTQTIDEVKAAIAAKWPELTTEKQRLIYNGKPLESGTLGDAKVQPGFTIQIIKRGGRKTYRRIRKTKKRPSN